MNYDTNPNFTKIYALQLIFKPWMLFRKNIEKFNPFESWDQIYPLPFEHDLFTDATVWGKIKV